LNFVVRVSFYSFLLGGSKDSQRKEQCFPLHFFFSKINNKPLHQSSKWRVSERFLQDFRPAFREKGKFFKITGWNQESSIPS